MPTASRSSFEGQPFDSNQWGATLTYNYARPLFGLLYFSFGTVNTAGNGNQGTLGFVGNLGLKKKINGWDIAADISYAQNVQSSLALYTTSNYNYGGFVRKRFGDFTYWSGFVPGRADWADPADGLPQPHSETALTTLSRRGSECREVTRNRTGLRSLLRQASLVPTPIPPLNPAGSGGVQRCGLWCWIEFESSFKDGNHRQLVPGEQTRPSRTFKRRTRYFSPTIRATACMPSCSTMFES